MSSNIGDYEIVSAAFNWSQVERHFGWLSDSKVNAAYEAIDKQVENGLGNKTALIYSDKSKEERYTYEQLQHLSNKFGNILRQFDVEVGDRVFIFMPRSPEFHICFLGAIKIGAIVGPLFEAFMSGAVLDRLSDSAATVLVTTEELLPRVPLDELPQLRHIIICGKSNLVGGKYCNFNSEIKSASSELEIEWLPRKAPMLIHYTSGSTGKPKGVVHAHNAILQHYQTGKWVLDICESDIYWCTADPGWVTGTSYGIFAPYLNGVTNIILGGRFDPQEWYATLERYRVNIWYSAPTAFRMLMKSGDFIGSDLSSLRHIISVGEPLNPEVIRWGKQAYGLQIHDNWWMTETGATMIANYKGMPIRLGSMGKPFPGIEADIIDDSGKRLSANQVGNLAIHGTWPSQMIAIWNNNAKYEEYFKIPGWYLSGDAAYKDEDGYFWFEGRNDDVINTSGERVGPFEVESSLIEHEAVAEAGVIGKPDSLRGEIIKAFVVLRDGFEPSDDLASEISLFVRNKLAAHAVPREVTFCEKLPKTRSGKIMRRLLKAQELGLEIGDTSTLEE